MNPILTPELERIYRLLRAHPNGLSEYELLEALRGQGPLRGTDQLELFRVHFLLFHHLYALRRELRLQQRGGLQIHCLRVRLLPLAGSPANPEGLPDTPDPLEEYYLDLDNLVRTTADDVRELLRWFWKRYRVQGRRDQALEVLDLGPDASTEEIRRRFRKLAFENHPDRGGDVEFFLQLTEAMEILRLHDRGPQLQVQNR